MESLGEYGVAIVAIGAVMASMKLVEKVIEKRLQNGKAECPYTRNEALEMIRKIDSTVKRTENAAKSTEQSVKHLVETHSKQMILLQEQSVRCLEKLIKIQSGST